MSNNQLNIISSIEGYFMKIIGQGRKKKWSYIQFDLLTTFQKNTTKPQQQTDESEQFKQTMW